MSFETAADRLEFIADFGESVTIAATVVRAIVDEEYFDTPLGEVGQEGRTPMLTLPTETVPAGAAENSAATVRGAAYKIANIEPDGTGYTTIKLL